MSEKLRSKPALLLKVLFILLNFIVPAILILWGSSEFGPFSDLPIMKNLIFIISFFLVLPVSITYLIVSLNRVFPNTLKEAFMFFIPYLVNLIIYSMKFGLSGSFFKAWLLQSLPLFLGYILAMVIGFLALFVKKFREQKDPPVTEWINKGAFMIGLTIVFLLSFFYMYSTGVRMISSHFDSIEKITLLIYFSFSILLVFIFHFGLLKILYKEGKL